ncbi:MAG: DUF340 domain-containing protein [Fretibacterium sp.]|nr:DUF340 domain-containing protein [Fretibacterium sp.]
MKLNFAESFLVLVVSGIIINIGNAVGTRTNFMESVPGMLILLGVIVSGMAIGRLIPIRNFPDIGWMTLVGIVISMPLFPYSPQVLEYTGKVNLLATATPVLSYAGIALAKDLGLLKEVGWKIAIVSVFVFIGTFVGSAVIAHVILKAQGII